MIIISHRRNTISELLSTPVKYGIEVDIRSSLNKLTIHHDPFSEGECFNSWIELYKHETLILNVKEEGLEQRLISCMEENNITNFFFLDQSFPFLIKWANYGEKRCAVRISEFESIDTALSLSGKVDWIWVDCFSRFPLNKSDYIRLKNAEFKLCLVSPELQGRTDESDILDLKLLLKSNGFKMDAVCTKRADLWEQA